MSTPTYRKFTEITVRRARRLRWSWEITDGIGGPLLLSGTRRTEGGARRAAVFASATCEPSLELRLDWIVARLHDDGIDVECELDEQGRVCVHPCRRCDDREHRRVMKELCKVGPVRWEVPR